MAAPPLAPPAGLALDLLQLRPLPLGLQLRPIDGTRSIIVTAEELTEQLGGHRNGREGSAPCPCHDDRKNSFSVGEGVDGKILVHCFAGCPQDSVIDALRARGLWPTARAKRTSRGKAGRLVARYDYKAEDGTLLFQKVRYEPKDFRLRRPDGHNGWIWSLQGVRPVLYRLPELVGGDSSQWVFIVEGEKDVDRLVKREFIATTSPFGGSKTASEKKWPAAFNGFFQDRKVAILPDNDSVGIEFGWHIAEQLIQVAAEVRIVELPDLPSGGDVSDFFERGGTRERLIELVNATEKLTELKVQFRKDQGGSSSQQGRAGAGAAVSGAAKKNQADLLVDLALAGAELFHDDDVAFATIAAGNHHETWAVKSNRFRLHILRLFYEAQRKVPDAKAGGRSDQHALR
jgi:hypothetical protein